MHGSKTKVFRILKIHEKSKFNLVNCDVEGSSCTMSIIIKQYNYFLQGCEITKMPVIPFQLGFP